MSPLSERMTYLTKRARAATFPLDQLLEARRRRVLICLACADDSESPGAADCIACGSDELMSPDDIIAANFQIARGSARPKG